MGLAAPIEHARELTIRLTHGGAAPVLIELNCTHRQTKLRPRPNGFESSIVR
jgi:hypothetical protein